MQRFLLCVVGGCVSVVSGCGCSRGWSTNLELKVLNYYAILNRVVYPGLPRVEKGSETLIGGDGELGCEGSLEGWLVEARKRPPGRGWLKLD